MNAITPLNPSAVMERVLLAGDLSKLDTKDRLFYYTKVCESVGLNPLTRPFDYLSLNGKTVLYAKRDATDQLRRIHGVSVIIKARENLEGVYVVTANAKDAKGREDESTGAVSIQGLKGDALANALMKAETKAKRRVTLSICGLGMLDETEIETVPGARVESVSAPSPDVQEEAPPEGFDSWWADMHALAEDGTEALSEAWGKSEVKFRKYVRDHCAKEWAELKAEAGR